MHPKVLITVPRLELPGGVANYYRTIRKYLGSNVEYFQAGAKPEESGAGSSLMRGLRDYWDFHTTLSEGRFSLVHLNPSLGRNAILRDALFLLIARGHRLPVLVFFHGWDAGFQSVIMRRFRWLFRMVYGLASGYMVLAEDHRKALADLGLPGPTFLMTTIVDDTVFQENPRALQRQAAAAVRILYLSRLDRGKGVVEAIKAFKIFSENRLDATLTVAGAGPERSAAEAITDSLSVVGVRFVGHVDGEEKRELFLESDIYFFPTFYGEGMPTSVLEAMAYGLPVVTRRVGGLSDFFEDGRMGMITTSKDPTDFAAMLERLAVDAKLRADIAKHNRAYAVEHFAASKNAEQLERIYGQILERK